MAKKKSSTPLDSILEHLNYRTFDSKYLKLGKNHEAAARRTYTNKMKKDHPGIVVTMCGLITNSNYPHLGGSPDGLVHSGQTESPIFVILCVLCFQRQSFLTFIV